MKQAKEWKVTLTANALDGYKKEVHYVWSDSRNQAKLIAMNLSTMNVLSAAATTLFKKEEETKKQEYTYEYRDLQGNELETDKIVTGPVTIEEAIEYVKQSIKELSEDTACTHILIVDEKHEEVERFYVKEDKQADARGNEIIHWGNDKEPVQEEMPYCACGTQSVPSDWYGFWCPECKSYPDFTPPQNTGVMGTKYQTWEELHTMWGIPQ